VRAGLNKGTVYVKKYNKSLPKSHQVSSLPLWRHVVVRPPATRAGQYVMRRYGVPLHTAEVIAVLAGLGESEVR
jgi:hypothetical protein